jgi:hypothetical protein
MLEYTISVFFLLGAVLVYNFYRSRRSAAVQINVKYDELIAKFELKNFLDDITMTQRVCSGKLYDTHNCEIRLKYRGRMHHGYFTFYHSNASNVVVSGRPLLPKTGVINLNGPPHETQIVQCAEVCMMLFFERHLPPVAQDIHKYRKAHYKWNVGRLAYLPTEPINTTTPN